MDLKLENTQYAYLKTRSQFGKWYSFSEHNKLEVDIKSDKSLMRDYIRVDPVTRTTQCSKNFSVHEVLYIQFSFI